MNIFFNILQKYFKEILIIGLIVVILLMRACSGDGETEPKEIIKVDGKEYELLEQKIDTVFVEKMGKGEVIMSSDKVSDWYVSEPGSIQLSAVKYVCK